MVSDERYDNQFPEVQFLEGWPKEDRPTLGMLVPIVFAVGLIVVACMCSAKAPIDQGSLVAVGFYGMVVGLFGLAYMFVSMLPRFFTRWDGGARRHMHNQYGTGIRLAMNRREQLRLFPFMTGMTVYGFCSWLDWHSGGNSLLPFSKASDGGATVALIFSVILTFSLIVFVIMIAFSMTIEIYPAGIVRKTPIHFRKDPEQFVSWEDVASLAPGYYSSGNAQNLPIIRVYINDSSAEPRDKLFDETGALSLPMNMVKCEPNSFLSIITFLKENPENRHLLASPDIGQWFLRVQRRNRPFWLKQPRMEDGS